LARFNSVKLPQLHRFYMNTISRGMKIVRNDGVLAFLRAILRFVYWNLGIRRTYLVIRHKINGKSTKVIVENSSVTLSTTTYSEFERFYELKGEREILSDIISETSDGDIFYDVGANVGLYSCLVGSAVSNHQIYSFEPHPVNAEALESNLKLNNINGTVFQLAISNEEGTFELSSEGTEAGLGEHSLDTSSSESTVSVSVRRLDKLRKEYNMPVPTIVKIDVEGAELDVIRGAADTFSDPHCKTLYCEVHPDRMKKFGGSQAELKSQLVNFGFDVETIDQKLGSRIILKATK